MFNFLTDFVPIYIKVYENRFDVLRVDKNKKEVLVRAVKPFSNEKYLIAEFKPAELLLRDALKKILDQRLLFGRNAKAIIHPMEKVGKTLTSIEKQILKELVMSAGLSHLKAGVIDVKVWNGHELTDEEIQYKIKHL